MEKAVKYKNLTWHHFTDNSEETIGELQKKFKFHPLDFEDITSGPQQPKVDFYDDYLFAIFHFPDYNEETKRIQVLELDLFLGKDYLATIAKNSNTALDEFIKKLEQEEELRRTQMEQGGAFLLYKIIDSLTETSWPVVRKISAQLNEIEENIYGETLGKSTVWNIALVKRNLIRMKRIINPQTIAVAALVKADKPYLKQDLSVYFDDISDTLSRIQSITEGHVDVVNSLHNVSESLISKKTNETITALTVISVSLLPLTLIASFYGMNVDLPWQNQPSLVYLFFVMIAGIEALAIFYYMRKD